MEKRKSMTAQKTLEPKYNREYKDSLFRTLFAEKEELLSLYNAVAGTNYTNPNDLVVNTLADVIYLSMKNDISFIIDGRLSLYEHQSTWNNNMPLRCLLYVANLYAGVAGKRDLYTCRKIILPNPQFVVFYNGIKRAPERSYQTLSESYKEGQEVNLELKVLVLNINQGYNEQLMSKCKRLREYAQYVAVVRRNLKTMETEEAVEAAIKECIESDILAEFLRKHRNEVKIKKLH